MTVIIGSVVCDIETILPLNLFPRVAVETVEYQGMAPAFECHTEYQSDPCTDTRDLITKVKDSVRIENLFKGSRSSTDGRWFKALCPFHDDHHESFWIDVQRQICGCQVCGFKPLDAINLYSKMHGISNSEAIVALAREINVWA